MTVPAEFFVLEINIETLVDICKTNKHQVQSYKLLSRDVFGWNSSLRPCSHPKMRQKQYPKTSLRWSSPVPDFLKQAMNDGTHTVWGILSCFQKGAFLLVLLALVQKSHIVKGKKGS